MDDDILRKEFEFLRDRIKMVGTSLVSQDIATAAFVLGSLHQICHEHSKTFGERANNLNSSK